MIEAQILENHKILISKNAVSDSVRYETIKFCFPKIWENYVKTAVFKNGETVVSVLFEKENPLYLAENECYIPHEVLKFPGFSVSVFGNEGESLATTARGFVTVLQSGYEQGDSPQEPTPSEYSQILAVMNETKDIAQSVRDDADNGVFKGEKGDTGPQGIQGEKGDKGEDADTSLFANTIKNTKSGSAVTINDISPVEHNLDIKLTSEKGEVNTFDISKLASSENMQVDAQSGAVIVSQYTKTEKSLGEICPRLKAGDEVTLKYTTKFENSWICFYSGMVDGVTTTFSPDGTYLKYSTLLVSDYVLTLPIEFYPDGTETYSNIQFVINGEIVPDFSNVKVSRYGKNFADIEAWTNLLLANDSRNGIVEFDGRRCLKLCATRTIDFALPKNIKLYGLSLNVYSTGHTASFMSFTRADQGNLQYYIGVPSNKQNEWYTVNRYYIYSSQNLTSVRFYKDNPNYPVYIDLDSVMLEESMTSTEYEPYTCETVTANADGTVEGIRSLYPTTTLTTDTEGVTIDVSYNADTKKYIDNKFAELAVVVNS